MGTASDQYIAADLIQDKVSKALELINQAFDKNKDWFGDFDIEDNMRGVLDELVEIDDRLTGFMEDIDQRGGPAKLDYETEMLNSKGL